jgi:4-hydroxy-tetrahydrodipicolinate synthase
MAQKPVRGLYAAVTLPRNEDGAVDECGLRRCVEFCLKCGLHGLVLNGATGEYCLTTVAELERALAVAAETAAGKAQFLCGIGSASLSDCLTRGKVAVKAGCRALLLPMPHFFPYGQDDLDAFCRAVAEALPAPILLYNLPHFTTPLEAATVRKLLSQCPNLIGIKDSSGSLDILRDLTRSGLPACRIVGSDEVLPAARREGLCDGVISGVAGVLPELLRPLLEFQPGSAPFDGAADELAEFLDQIRDLPVPWGLKWMAEIRGIAVSGIQQAVSQRRLAQRQALQRWFEQKLRSGSNFQN